MYDDDNNDVKNVVNATHFVRVIALDRDLAFLCAETSLLVYKFVVVWYYK